MVLDAASRFFDIVGISGAEIDITQREGFENNYSPDIVWTVFEVSGWTLLRCFLHWETVSSSRWQYASLKVMVTISFR